MPRAKIKEIAFEGDVYVDRVSSLRDELLKAFDKYDEIRLDIEKVTDFDVAGF